jgi:membrane protein YqaA with SNARE-associated domain|tara:strand:+ start:12105 stop:12725 length:621 start_codon:yes stop_codon:yes gene_type:complete
MNFIKKLYAWVLSWADKPNGNKFLAILSFSEASFFPIPPDVLLIPLCLGNRNKAYRFAFTCSLFSILGAILGFYIGKVLWWNTPGIEYSYLANTFFNYVPGINVNGFNNIKAMYSEWNFWIVFTAGFTPIPFKLITISAGTFNINFFMFVIASILSRSARFFIVASLIKVFGEPIEEFIEKYFNLLAIIFTALLIGGFIFIKFLIP